MADSWSLDFCMVCDKQTLGGPYCSQTCRLTEMDKCSFAGTAPSSPELQPTTSSVEWPACTSSYYAGLKSSPPTSPSLHSDSYGLFLREMSPSSSSTSSSDAIISSANSPAYRALSSEVQIELDHYSGLFDKGRSRHRRISYTSA
ncbi:hypothetical protein AAP_00834 [Ascosphaera apis ARSEF 7405]|uniref:Life-span regulatory factor n=1 Tax=Ascosphaera apis ARSEF 7405 TaxID=392613 RepID=A0A168CZD0_9EURO|nr:hypothetical protein AAP_00834 [Ascosphaera apis ARSEF 7405]